MVPWTGWFVNSKNDKYTHDYAKTLEERDLFVNIYQTYLLQTKINYIQVQRKGSEYLQLNIIPMMCNPTTNAFTCRAINFP